MAQKRLRDYQSQLGSWLHNIINLGVHLPGRFSGYDTLQITGANQFSLAHAGGINTFDGLGNPYGPLGVAMTIQGEIIIEDAPVPGLIVLANNTAQDRTDWVIMTHQYLQITGGADATYSVITGPNQILQPFQVILGTLLVPAGTQGIVGCAWTKAKCPDSGDSPDAKLSAPNTFGAINANAMFQFPFSAPSGVDGVGANVYDLPPQANSYPFNPVNNIDIDGIRIIGFAEQDGMEINIVINRYCRIRGGMTMQNGSPYEPIVFSTRLSTGNVIVNGQAIPTFQPPADDTAVWIVGLIKYQGRWIVKSIDGPGFSPAAFISGMTIAVDMPIGNVPTNFDNYGLGIGIWTGWQIANGNGNTSDWRGRFPVGATDVPSQGQPAIVSTLLPPGITKLSQGSFGGSAQFTISKANLPALGLKILSNASGGQSPWFVMDGGGGGGNYSLKGDSDNSLANGFVTTENMGSGTPFAMMPAYQVTMWVTKL